MDEQQQNAIFQIGDKVCAKGIKAKPELNGVQGEVVKIMDERIGIDFGPAMGVKALKRENLQFVARPAEKEPPSEPQQQQPAPTIITQEVDAPVGGSKKKNKKKKKKKNKNSDPQQTINTPDTAVSSTPPTPGLGPFSIGRPRDEVPVPSAASSSPRSTPAVSPNPSPHSLSPLMGPPGSSSPLIGTPSSGPKSPAISAQTPPKKFRCTVPVVCDTVHPDVPGGMIREDSVLDKSRHVAFNEERDIATYDPSNKETPEEKEALRKQMRAAKLKEEELAKKRRGVVAVVEDEVVARKLIVKEQQKRRKSLKSIQRNEEVEIEINQDAKALEGSLDICSDESLARRTIDFDQQQQYSELQQLFKDTPIPEPVVNQPTCSETKETDTKPQFTNPGDIFLNWSSPPPEPEKAPSDSQANDPPPESSTKQLPQSATATPQDKNDTSSQDQLIAELERKLQEANSKNAMLEEKVTQLEANPPKSDFEQLQRDITEQKNINKNLTTKITALELSEKDHKESLQQIQSTAKSLSAQLEEAGKPSNKSTEDLKRENEKLKTQMTKGFEAMRIIEEEGIKQKKLLRLFQAHDNVAYKRAVSLVGDLAEGTDGPTTDELQAKLDKANQNYKSTLTKLLEEQRKNRQLTTELSQLGSDCITQKP